MSQAVAVKPTPKAGFTFTEACYGTATQFRDTTDANGSQVLTYRWESGVAAGDTMTGRNPGYTYPKPGVYTPRLVVTSETGCRDTAEATVRVFSLPKALWSSSVACQGQPSWFFDRTEQAMAPLSEWGWKVQGIKGEYVGTMKGQQPYFVFDTTGLYRVLLTVTDTNGCSDTLRKQVEVNPSPSGAFSYTGDYEGEQGRVKFDNGTIGGDEYHWDFGNGKTSTAVSPQTVYAEDGVYQVVLSVLNGYGCSDTVRAEYRMLYKGLWIPNAMAPGGPVQATRYWKPVGVNLASYKAEVYNTHGVLLWKSTLLDDKGSPTESWDGTYKGRPCQQDVYVWKIQALFRDGTIWENNDTGNHEGLSEPAYGTITMVR